MSASRASFAALVWVPVALVTAGAWAEEPLRLWRPQPDRASPSGETGGLQSRSPVAPVEVQKLAPPDPEAVGIPQEAHGLGQKLWAGSRRSEIADLIRQLPPRVDSAVLYDLLRRVLLASAPPPAGAADGPGLLPQRVARLATIGAVDDAAALLDVARERDGTLDRLALDVALLRHDLPAACEAARAGIEAYAEPYWQKALIFCQVQAEERDRAALGADLLREMDRGDPAFFVLLEALLGMQPAKLAELPDATPLHLAMLRAAEVPVPAELLRDAKPALLRSIALNRNASLPVRLEAAEKAVAAQALDPERLAELYGRVERAPDGAAEPDGWALEDRARLLTTAVLATDPAARAGALQRLLTRARERGGYEPAARAAWPLIDGLSPGGRLAFFAGEAARAALLVGQPARARDWHRLAVREAQGNARAARDAVTLTPLLRLADPRGPAWPADEIGRWWSFQLERDPEQARRRATLLFTLFDALGEPVPQRAWSLVRAAAEAGPAPPPAASPEGLQEAAADGRRGETVLRAVLAVASADDLTDPAVMHGVVRALRLVGLEREARALAVEAALAAGT